MEPIIAFLMDWNFNRLSFLYVHSKGKSIYSTGKSSWHFANIAIGTYMLSKLFTRFDVTYTYTHLKILNGDLERDEIGEYNWELIDINHKEFIDHSSKSTILTFGWNIAFLQDRMDGRKETVRQQLKA